MQKILISALILILFSPVTLFSPVEGSSYAQPADDFYPNWFDSEMVVEKVEGPHSRGVEVPPVQMQNAIADIIDDISDKYLEDFLTKFVGFGSRLYRAPGMANASVWLHDVLQGNGRIQTEYHNFSTTTSYGTFLLSNVILTIPGVNQSSDEIYYLFAHSDAVQMDDPGKWLTFVPGADDDGSGCVAVLEAARVLSRYKFHDTIKFAFFQAEEIGLRGSAAYAQTMQARGENVPASIDYDMIGYTTGSPEYGLDLLFNAASADIGLHMMGVNERYDIGLSISAYQTSSSIPSDIQSFYNRGFPCAMGIETEFSPYYHSTSDLVKYINFSLVQKTTQMAVASLAEWARLLYVDVSIPQDNLNLSIENPNEDDIVEVSVNITNEGNIDANNLEVVYYSNGEPFASKRLDVPAYGSNISTAQWSAVKGNNNISVVLDPKNEIVETDETNNTAFIHIGVNDRPRTVLTAVPMTVLTNETVTFNGSLSWDEVGGVTEYNFAFGDDKSSGWVAASEVTHSYHEDGTYVASLVVQDPYGAVSRQTNLTITVLNRAPFASPFSDQTMALTFTPIHFYANAKDPDGQVTTTWYFDDSTADDRMDTVHEFTRSGGYSVLLEVIDDDGAGSNYHLDILILNRAPICSIDASTVSGNIETGFSLNAKASDRDGSIAAYFWDMGDGTVITSQLAEHRYKKPGIYHVVLTVTDDEGATATAKLNITLIDEPPEAAGEARVSEVQTFEKVYFDGSRSEDLEGPVTYVWDFGDGNTSIKMAPEHAYYQIGSYTVSLTVRDESGQTDTMVLPTVFVKNRPPKAELTIFGNFTENGTVYFDGMKSSDVEGDLNYFWQFGDESTATGALAEHVYTEAGDYFVYLTVTDSEGETNTAKHLLTVNPAPPKPVIDDEPDDENDNRYLLYFNALMITNIIWIVLLIITLYLLFARKKKEELDKRELPLLSTEPVELPAQYYPQVSPAPFPGTGEQHILPANTAVSSPAPDPSPPIDMLPVHIPQQQYHNTPETQPIPTPTPTPEQANEDEVL